MATRKGAKGGGRPAGPSGDVDLSTHPLVANVDPSEIEPPPPELATLVGYLGPSRRDGSIRLYRDLTFRNFYEIPSDGIVSTKPVNPDDENSPTLVQVDPDTKVEVVNVSVQSVEARYLSGSISGGLYGAAAGGAADAQAAGTLCGNITTYMPSCVHCNPNCIATVVTSGVPGGGQACIDLYTANPSHCAQQCDPNCVATVVTSHHAPAAFAARAAQPPQFCITLYTANPSHCGQQNCLTVLTANPTDCGPCLTHVTANPTDCGRTVEAAAAGPAAMYGGPAAGAGAQFCLVTRYPTNCGPVLCATYYTARPSNCGPVLCATITYPTQGGTVCRIGGFPTRIVCNTNFPSCVQDVTVTILNDPGPLARGGFAQAQAAPPPMCITLHTAAPTWCEPCQPIANTAATLCTQHITTPQDRGICPTVYTAQPTGACG
jgi:hypothetical protein